MRNWNNWNPSGSVVAPSGFYSTYEELKPLFPDPFIQRLTGFYSTYEELKLPKGLFRTNFNFVFLQYLWGIETLTQSEQCLQTQQVFTVPMRNWNPASCIIFSNLFPGFYSTYEELKRFHFLLNSTTPALFLQYLWGIETFLLIICINSFISFYSTYEELKHIPITFLNFWNNMFLQYLWGIETAVSYKCIIQKIMFLQYLWGIET